MSGSILGNNVKRVEDPRFLTGEGRFVDDLAQPDALHLALVRSTIAHGTIDSIDTDVANAMPGVIAVHTADSLDLKPIRAIGGAPVETGRPPLARQRVRFVGDVVAVVVAESAEQARDAADMVWADIDMLPVVADVEAAVSDGAPVIHEALGSNVVETFEKSFGDDPMAGAEVVVQARFKNQRMAAVPLEGTSALAIPDGDGVRVYTGSQLIHGHAKSLAAATGLDANLLHLISPDTGGGFGPKFQVYVGQILCVALARQLGRPVKWIEPRSDNMVDMCHGRAQVQDITLASTREGILTGLSIDVIGDAGAYPTFGARIPYFTMVMATGPYLIPNVAFNGRSVITNTTPTHAYRGAGRPEATAMLERAIDMLANELEMDPVTLRRKNLIAPSAFPHDTAMGLSYDVGEYELALDRALELAGYDDLRAEQRTKRERGDQRQIGIGVSTYVEITDLGSSEWSSVEIEPGGGFAVRVGTGGTGQGHETAFAQIVGEVFQIPHQRVRVIMGDTAEIPKGGGTGGSRSLQVGGSAVLNASEGLADKAKRIVAFLKEASPEDIVITSRGTIGVAGVPDSEISWDELVELVASATQNLPEDLDSLRHEEEFGQKNSTFPFGTHISVVEVDTSTGDTRVLRHIAVDDCGKILNRVLVDGQVHGGAAQGLGQALIEHVQYDEDANPLTANLVTYLIPSATMVPTFEVDHTETPTPRNPLGAKGIGESGTVGSTPAIQNAVIDAVRHLGVRHIDMPATPSHVWEAIQAAGEASNS